jgi:hypothetical protein
VECFVANESNDLYEAPISGEQPTSSPPGPLSKPGLRHGRSMPAWSLVSIGVAAGLVIGIGSTLVVGSVDFSESPFTAAVDNCGISEGSSAVIGDEGASLDLDHQGADESTGISLNALVCVLSELEAPDSVVAEMNQTRALDGRQSAKWDGIHASWGYHPDSGLDVVLGLS